MNPWAVLIKTFVDPVKAFAFLKEKPFITVALILSLVMGCATAYFITHYMDESSIRSAIRESMEKRGGTMSDTQIEEFAAKQAAISRIAGPVAGLVMPALLYLILALIFFLAFKLLDADFSYRQSLSVTVHGFLPGILSSLIVIGMILKTGTVDPATAENLVPSNLGFLTDKESHKALFSFLSSFDFFSLWSLGLLTLGFGTLTGKGFKGALPVTAGLWAVYVAGKVGLTAVFAR